MRSIPVSKKVSQVDLMWHMRNHYVPGRDSASTSQSMVSSRRVSKEGTPLDSRFDVGAGTRLTNFQGTLARRFREPFSCAAIGVGAR